MNNYLFFLVLQTCGKQPQYGLTVQITPVTTITTPKNAIQPSRPVHIGHQNAFISTNNPQITFFIPLHLLQ